MDYLCFLVTQLDQSKHLHHNGKISLLVHCWREGGGESILRGVERSLDFHQWNVLILSKTKMSPASKDI